MVVGEKSHTVPVVAVVVGSHHMEVVIVVVVHSFVEVASIAVSKYVDTEQSILTDCSSAEAGTEVVHHIPLDSQNPDSQTLSRTIFLLLYVYVLPSSFRVLFGWKPRNGVSKKLSRYSESSLEMEMSLLIGERETYSSSWAWNKSGRIKRGGPDCRA